MEDGGYYSLLTKAFDNESDLDEKQEYIFPSLLQDNIDKEIEIRTFVLFEKIYSMASLSQRNEATRTDLRNYDLDRLNRVISYKLPDNVEQKILTFMKKAKLNTGSIDLIKTKDNRYIFLEVNPAGNIEMVSKNSNYHIEKEFAGLEVNKTKMDPIKGGKSLMYYDAHACDAYNWDYKLHWSDGSTTRMDYPR
ncbi:MAG: hypothetical protein QM654_18240 [Dysgonamonadaceae bacterium]